MKHDLRETCGSLVAMLAHMIMFMCTCTMCNFYFTFLHFETDECAIMADVQAGRCGNGHMDSRIKEGWVEHKVRE